MTKIIFTGDYFYNYKFFAKDLNLIFDELSLYDASFINFEGSFQSNERHTKSVNLSMSNESLNVPKNTNLILCNNHSTDYGEKGIINTIDKLNAKGIHYFGINKDKNDNSFLFETKINKKNFLIATLGWENEECIPAKENSMGIKPFSKKSIDELKLLIKKKKSDFNILYIHAGYEWEKYPLPDHVGLARRAIDSGFDMVYFCHSHTVQDYEIYNSKLIHYGLGNFYFSSRRSSFPQISDEGCCLILDIDHNINYKYRNITYDRENNFSMLGEEKDLPVNSLPYSNLEEYSKNYKFFRTRKKNPRPILYYGKDTQNFLKFLLWKFIADVLGFLNLRKFAKKIVGWD